MPDVVHTRLSGVGTRVKEGHGFEDTNIRLMRCIKCLEDGLDDERHIVMRVLIQQSSQLTPFVTNQIQPMRGSYGSRKMQPISGHNYLAKWKKENGED